MSRINFPGDLQQLVMDELRVRDLSKLLTPLGRDRLQTLKEAAGEVHLEAMDSSGDFSDKKLARVKKVTSRDQPASGSTQLQTAALTSLPPVQVAPLRGAQRAQGMSSCDAVTAAAAASGAAATAQLQEVHAPQKSTSPTPQAHDPSAAAASLAQASLALAQFYSSAATAAQQAAATAVDAGTLWARWSSKRPWSSAAAAAAASAGPAPGAAAAAGHAGTSSAVPLPFPSPAVATAAAAAGAEGPEAEPDLQSFTTRYLQFACEWPRLPPADKPHLQLAWMSAVMSCALAMTAGTAAGNAAAAQLQAFRSKPRAAAGAAGGAPRQRAAGSDAGAEAGSDASAATAGTAGIVSDAALDDALGFEAAVQNKRRCTEARGTH